MNECPEGQIHPDYTVGGIDISTHQAGVDGATARARGVRFIIIRAGWGNTRDLRFISHRSACQRAGLPWGAYWYWHPGYNEMEQAHLFKQVVGTKPPLGVWADFERSMSPLVQQWPLLSKDQVATRIGRFLNYCDKEFSGRTGIYTSRGFWDDYVQSKWWLGMRVNSRPRWVAQYLYQFGKQPRLPAGWSGWELWQFSAEQGPWSMQAREFGVTGSTSVDVNVFNGNEEKFRRYFKLAARGMGERPKNEPELR